MWSWGIIKIVHLFCLRDPGWYLNLTHKVILVLEISALVMAGQRKESTICSGLLKGTYSFMTDTYVSNNRLTAHAHCRWTSQWITSRLCHGSPVYFWFHLNPKTIKIPAILSEIHHLLRTSITASQVFWALFNLYYRRYT